MFHRNIEIRKGVYGEAGKNIKGRKFSKEIIRQTLRSA
jgi:hypothetical protein